MITIVGDIHAKKSNLDKQDILFEMVEALDNEHVVLTGDLLDNKAIVRSECMNFLYDKFRTSKRQFHIVVGNHDQHNLNTLEHSLEPLKALPNVTIYDKTTEFIIGALSFVAIPYIHSAEAFVKEVKKIRNPQHKILLCHQGFTGFDYGNGYIAKEETDSSSVKDFGLVIIGHFHKYQQFKNGCYIGTPFSQSFGESNQTKYLGVLRKEGVLDLVETSFPRHMTYEVDCDKEQNVAIEADNYNRIILTGSKDSIMAFDKSSLEGAKVLSRPTSEKVVNNVEISENLSNTKKFELWAENVGQFDKSLIKLGVEVLKSVSC